MLPVSLVVRAIIHPLLFNRVDGSDAGAYLSNIVLRTFQSQSQAATRSSYHIIHLPILAELHDMFTWGGSSLPQRTTAVVGQWVGHRTVADGIAVDIADQVRSGVLTPKAVEPEIEQPHATQAR